MGTFKMGSIAIATFVVVASCKDIIGMVKEANNIWVFLLLTRVILII